MRRTLIKDLPEKIGEVVKIQGFVERVRDQKYVQFVVIREASGCAQVVIEKSPENSLSDQVGMLTEGSTVTFTGKLVEAPKVKLGGVEIQASNIEIHSVAATPLPIQDNSSPELCIDNRHVSLRRPEQQLIYTVQSSLEAAMMRYWKDNNFTIMHTPKLMSAASESGAEVFEVKYFDRKAYLAQSPQFYKQMTIAGGIEKYAEIGSIFRADPSATSRHNSEFIGIDMEIAWVDSHEDVMDLEEAFLKYVFASVANDCGEKIEQTFGVDVNIPNGRFPRISLPEAKEILANNGHQLKPEDDLDPLAERMLAKHFKEKTGHDFFFATDYPAEVRAFYHMRYDDRPNITRSFDLIYKGLEITTGAQREHRVDILKNQAIQKGLNPDDLKSYFGFFAHGVPPHGGLGIGLARLLSGMLGQSGVTPVTLLPRTMTRLTP